MEKVQRTKKELNSANEMRGGDRVREKAIAKWAYQQGNLAYVMESDVCFRCFCGVEMQRNDPRRCCSLVISDITHDKNKMYAFRLQIQART